MIVYYNTIIVHMYQNYIFIFYEHVHILSFWVIIVSSGQNTIPIKPHAPEPSLKQ